MADVVCDIQDVHYSIYWKLCWSVLNGKLYVLELTTIEELIIIMAHKLQEGKSFGPEQHCMRRCLIWMQLHPKLCLRVE